MIKNIIIIFSCLLFSSCKISEDESWKEELYKWNGREIQIPSNLKFSIYGENEVDNVISKGYKIVHYVDSVGCTSCKLNLLGWKNFITELTQ